MENLFPRIHLLEKSGEIRVDSENFFFWVNGSLRYYYDILCYSSIKNARFYIFLWIYSDPLISLNLIIFISLKLQWFIYTFRISWKFKWWKKYHLQIRLNIYIKVFKYQKWKIIHSQINALFQEKKCFHTHLIPPN